MIVLAAFCVTQSKQTMKNSDNLSTTAQFKSELPVQLKSELDAQFHRNMQIVFQIDDIPGSGFFVSLIKIIFKKGIYLSILKL
jgi:hypothetical protein